MGRQALSVARQVSPSALAQRPLCRLSCRHASGHGNQTSSQQAASAQEAGAGPMVARPGGRPIEDGEMMTIAAKGAQALDKREAAYAKRKAR